MRLVPRSNQLGQWTGNDLKGNQRLLDGRGVWKTRSPTFEHNVALKMLFVYFHNFPSPVSIVPGENQSSSFPCGFSTTQTHNTKQLNHPIHLDPKLEVVCTSEIKTLLHTSTR
jgi:hypothetical protein